MEKLGEVVICDQFKAGNCDGKRCPCAKSHLKDWWFCDDVCILNGEEEVYQKCIPVSSIVRRTT